MYYGGKNGAGTYQHIINQIPPHEVYHELFLGSGAILNNKRPANINLGIEVNAAVIDKFVYTDRAQIINTCALKYLNEREEQINRNQKTFFYYLDPPYPLQSRKNKKPVYDYEFTDDQHEELLKIITSMRAMVAISTYKNSLYEKALKDWRLYKFESQTRHGKAIEYLYMNYDEPTELHDYNYLGSDFTDRQRIKRKIQREINKLKKLPLLERQAIINGIRSFID